MATGEFDVSDLPVEGEKPALGQNLDMSKSVLSPDYRPRSPLGGQEIGGLIGSIGGGIGGGLIGGPPGAMAGSVAGSALGGALGETYEQVTRNESTDPSRIGMAGVEEALWDLGGNLVIKGAGKTLRFGADKLGFTSKDVPDANAAAQAFLQKYGSSLPESARTGNNMDAALEGFVRTPATYDLFKDKQAEIRTALTEGSQDVLKSLVNSKEFDQALRSGSSAQAASGEVLQNFIKEGQKTLSDSVEPLYADIFKDVKSTVSTFPIKSWASKELTSPASLTAGQKSILNELNSLPPNVDFQTLHKIRSRWLAENRDKYASSVSSNKDSRASSTISDLVTKIDNAMDMSANSLLDPNTLKQYRQVTKTYREGVQGLQSDAVVSAMSKNPEEVGGFLFAAGNETPIKDLYKSVAAAQTLTKKPSKDIIDSLRFGYLDALVNTPENMLKFATDIEQNKNMQNTFNALFRGTPQYDAIKAMNEASKLGLVQVQTQSGLVARTAGVAVDVAKPLATLGTGYFFLLSPEQQERVKDNLGSAAVAGGGLVLSQRQLAKVMLNPQGAKAVTFMSTARDKLTSPSAFTKLVAEPLANILGGGSRQDLFRPSKGEFDINDIPVK
jgi:hypothetical protein